MFDPEHVSAPTVETERKFVIDRVPAAVFEWPSMIVRQGYISQPPDELRVRRTTYPLQGDFHFIERKVGKGLSREEHSMPVSADHFEYLWPLTDDVYVGKTRYYHPDEDGNTLEVDVYENVQRTDVGLSGSGPLVIAEVEFASEENARNFVVPLWFGIEVTEDPQFKNAALAR